MRSNTTPPPVRQMIREAVEALGSPTTNVAVRDWIEARYPGTNPGTIQAQITICTVNHPARVKYTQNRLPRTATDPRYDFLFRQGRGQLEWYRPERHGLWSIAQADKGRLAICRRGGELIYTSAQHKPKSSGKEERGKVARVTPVTQAQIDAANALQRRLPTWAATDRAFERLKNHFGWDLEGCILKVAAINDLYSTRVYAVWRMSEHLRDVMRDPPDDPAALVEKIACLPGEDGSVSRKHWSFASKISHFFAKGDFPIYDSFSRGMIEYHLGRDGCESDGNNPYRDFITNLNRLRQASALWGTLRDLDRYLWLAGQYRGFLRKGKRAQLNSELKALFKADDPELQRLLQQLCPAMQRTQ